MRRDHRYRRLGWTLLTFAFASAAGAQKGGPTVEADSRLRAQVAFAQTAKQRGEPLADYLQRLSRSQEITHTADAPFDAAPLVALGTSISLARLQRALARTYHLTWRAVGEPAPGYALRQSAVDKQARINARSRAALVSRGRVTARMDLARRIAFASPSGLEVFLAKDPDMVQSKLHPRGRAGAKLYWSLPAPVWREFWAVGKASTPVSGLSPELQDLVRQTAGSTRVTTSDGEDYRTSDRVGDGQLHLQWGGTLDRPTIWGSLRYGNHGVDTNLLYAEGFRRQPPSARRKQARSNPSKTPDSPVFKRRISLRDDPHRAPAVDGERPDNARPLAAYLRQVSEQLGISVFAECEYKDPDSDREAARRWLQQQWWLGAEVSERPAAEALDLLCADFEYEWEYRDGALLFRPKRWYADASERGYVYPSPPWMPKR